MLCNVICGSSKAAAHGSQGARDTYLWYNEALIVAMFATFSKSYEGNNRKRNLLVLPLI